MNETLEFKLKQLPDVAGVYLMKDDVGKVIYVGKATSLKSRVRSYFQTSANHSPKTRALVEHIADLDYIVLNSPSEALILECNLIKEYAPRYNIMLRDDKHYPYLKLTLTEDFPRLVIVRSTKKDGNRYFGPYVSSGAMQMSIKTITKLFPLRTCSNNEFKNRHRPCLNHQIGKCTAPCCGMIEKGEYAKMVQSVSLFLEGRTKEVIRDLQQKMFEASNNLAFEQAGIYRDRIEAIKLIQSQQQMDLGEGDSDIITLAQSEENLVVQVFMLRNGKVCGREHFFMINFEEMTEGEILANFILQYYSTGVLVPSELYLQELPENIEEIQEFLTGLRGRKVNITRPMRGDKFSLLKIARTNAQSVLGREIEKINKEREISEVAMLELQQVLGLDIAPYRLECFDNSHIQGTNTVSSMVVFCGGKPARGLYRRFKIKGSPNGNDLIAMREVLTRRVARTIGEIEAMKKGELKLEDARWAVFPDLLVVDGGRGQLGIAMDILETLQLKINVIGLAEENEYIYLPNQSEPIILSKDSPALQLLQRLRDEAHRFAVTYHRNLRGKGQVHSILDEIGGIGEKRRQELLHYFGDVAGIMASDIETISSLPSMNRSTAEKLYYYLQENYQIEDENKGEDENDN